MKTKKLAFIIVLGKPGTGKSWLSYILSKKYNLELLTPPHVIYDPKDSQPQTDANGDLIPIEKDQHEIPIASIAPLRVPPVEITEWIEKNVYKGMVIDGSVIQNNNFSLDNLEAIYKEKLAHSHQSLILNLDISDSELMNRRVTQYVDPITDLLYREEQLLATPMQFSIQQETTSVVESGADGEAEEAVDPKFPNMPFSIPVFDPVDLTDRERLLLFEDGISWLTESLASIQSDDSAESEERKERYEKYLKLQKYYETIEKPPKWNKISLEVRRRLRKRACDMENSVITEIASYCSSVEVKAQKWMANMEKFQIFNIDAAQTPLSVLFSLWLWMETQVSRHVVLSVASKVVQMSMDSVKGLSSEKALLRLLEEKSEGMPSLHLGTIANQCVVSRIDKGTIVFGDPYFSVTYRGALYVFANQEMKKKFEDNAPFYLTEADKFKPIPFPIDSMDSDFFLSPNTLGFCKDFCPVSLKQGIIRKGLSSIAVSYQKHYFLFASIPNRNLFLQSPDDYLLSSVDDIAIPEARIAFCGTKKTGKSMVHSHFTSKLTLVSFEDLVKKYTDALTSEDARKEIAVRMHMSEEISVDVLNSIFGYMDRDLLKKGFMLEGFPRNHMDIEFLIKSDLYHVDAILFFSASFESLSRRIDFADESESDILSSYTNRLNSALEEATADVRLLEGVEMYRIDCNKSIRKVMSDVKPILHRIYEKRATIFCQSHILSPNVVETLISDGVALRSDFGHICPVALSTKTFPVYDCQGTFPVLVNGRIYYCKTKEFVQLMVSYPLNFINTEFPRCHSTPVFSIIGSGPDLQKDVESLCKRVALEMKMKYVSLQNAQEQARKRPNSPVVSLANMNPFDMTPEQKLKLFQWVFKQSLPNAQGVITDAFFSNEVEYEAMKAVMPWKIYEIHNGPAENTTPIHKLRRRIEQDIINPWMSLDIEANPLRFIRKDMLETIYSRYAHQYAIENDKASKCFQISMTQQDFNERLTDFGLYCPVTFVDENELVRVNTNEHLVLYKNKLYATVSAAAAQRFIKNPSIYTDGLTLPEDIAKRSAANVKSQLAFKGYCPVAFSKGGEIVMGKLDFTSEYGSKVYAMSSEHACAKFIAAPWKYVDQVLPNIVPPAHLNAKYYNLLSFPSYIDETLTALLNQSLIHLAQVKPLLPTQNMSSSALIYVYLYLKSNNANLTPFAREKYRKQLSLFVETCKDYQDLTEKIGSGVSSAALLSERLTQLVFSPREEEQRIFSIY